MSSSEVTTPGGIHPGGGWKRRLRTLVGVCCWGYPVVALGVWVLMWWTDRWWLATLVAFAPRWPLALPAAVLLPAALFVRRQAVVGVLVGALLVVGPVMGLCVPWRPWVQAPSGIPSLRVLTCNMHYARRSTGLLEKWVAETDPDLVAVQEWPGSRYSPLLTAPGWYVHREESLFLASRHPILRATELGHNSTSPQGLVTLYELDTPVGVVHVLSLHLASPRQGLAEAIHDKDNREEGLQANSEHRWQQSEFVADQARLIHGPLLLMGDFNTTPQSALFDGAWGEYNDAFAVAGLGWGYTFVGGRTQVRIDHILTGKGWYCRHCQVGPEVGSPHRPVLADLIWRDDAGLVLPRPLD